MGDLLAFPPARRVRTDPDHTDDLLTRWRTLAAGEQKALELAVEIVFVAHKIHPPGTPKK